MRGKVKLLALMPAAVRITPAYAGKRKAQHAAEDVTGDHPRLCGEKMISCGGRMSIMGSPPPMRGKEGYILEGSIFCGITPAYAGKRPMHTEKDIPWQDHPRLCGEKAFFLFVHTHFIRITPAYAGKRSFAGQAPVFCEDHPRLCGEKHALTACGQA